MGDLVGGFLAEGDADQRGGQPADVVGVDEFGEVACCGGQAEPGGSGQGALVGEGADVGPYGLCLAEEYVGAGGADAGEFGEELA